MDTSIVAQRHGDLLIEIQRLEETIRKLQFNSYLNMYNQAGLMHQIDRLPAGTYTVVFADIDKMKAINTATGSHDKTNVYLAAGLRVRQGEISGQLFGDEIVFILQDTDAEGFIARIAAQLKAQPLTIKERRELIASGGKPYLSAMFAYRSNVSPDQIRNTIAELSADVLAQKADRDAAH